uniref:Uncharacterized protein n=1 Tax=Arundo donax TaxID=35708 RepID=A0A0A9G0Z4_ARUDO
MLAARSEFSKAQLELLLRFSGTVFMHLFANYNKPIFLET